MDRSKRSDGNPPPPSEKPSKPSEQEEPGEEDTRDQLISLGRNLNPFLEEMRARPRTKTEIGEFVASDGCPLFYRYWIPKTSKSEEPPEKIVICIHGLHSHGEKFVLLADYLAKKPWRVFAMDLRGHGLSYNETHKRGDIEDFSLWIQDGLEFIAYLQKKFPKTPVYLVAESMGAALAVLFAHRTLQKIQALVLLSPALKPFPLAEIRMIQKAFAYGLFRGADNLNIRDRAQGRFSTNSEAFIRYQMNDKLRLERVTPRYYYQVVKMIHQLKPLEYSLFSPSCIFFGDKDHVIDLQGMKEYIKRLDLTDKCLYYVPGGFHELLTDENGQKYRIYRKIRQWIQLH